MVDASPPQPVAPDAGVLDELDAQLAAIEDAIERVETGGVDAAALEHGTGDRAPSGSGAGPVQSPPPEHEEPAMGFATDKLGHWTEGPEFVVDAQRTEAYAAATNDSIPEHTSGAVAPPVFAVVPIWDTMAGAMAGVVPPEVLLLVVHGEQDMRFHQPIRPGMVLRSQAAPIGIHVKPNGTTVVVKVETRDQTGALVAEQYMTSFFRGVSEGESAGEEAPDHKLTAETKGTEPVATVTQRLDDDQTYRYAEASGDHMPIHLDAEVARSVGLPGIIIHGLCTMAFTSVAALTELCDGDTARLRRLAVRFSRPVLPGQEITTTFWRAGASDGATVFGYETRNGDGEVVIKDGLVEVADPA
jgi:acyl dehydratase